MSEECFVKASGLSYQEGRSVYLKAKGQALASAHYFEAAKDAMFGTFNTLTVSNQAPIVNDLKEIVFNTVKASVVKIRTG